MRLRHHPSAVIAFGDHQLRAGAHENGELELDASRVRHCSKQVDNHVLRLRKHIEPDPERPRYIRTARGAGYFFDPDAPAEGGSEP